MKGGGGKASVSGTHFKKNLRESHAERKKKKISRTKNYEMKKSVLFIYRSLTYPYPSLA